jgi:EAL domain-containing protein (putative c-di-GMP-specific phosphodiesterase class I)
MPLRAEVEQAYRVRELIEALLAEPRQLGPDYQPIHSLPDGVLVGYKATGRGAPGTALADTLSLLDSARSLGLVERIDWAFRALAMEDMLSRPHLELHLTPEPETYGTPCAPRFAALMARANRELTVAAEVYGEVFEPGVALRAGLEEIRRWGWRVVLSDVADEPEALAGAALLAPDVVQLDLRLPGRSDAEPPTGVRRLLELAGERTAPVMALGVDSPRLLDRALELGATLARGAVFGHPGPLPGA